mgnify:CR=1 FL=1
MCNDNRETNSTVGADNSDEPARQRRMVNLTNLLPTERTTHFDKIILKISEIEFSAANQNCFNILKANLSDGFAGGVFRITNNSRNTNSATNNYINITIERHLLYSGKITLKKVGTRNAVMSMDLTLNPSRFIAHLNSREEFQGTGAYERLEQATPNSVLTANSSYGAQAAQLSLRHNDNHFGLATDLFTQSTPWQLTMLYIRKVMEHIINTMMSTGNVRVTMEGLRYAEENGISINEPVRQNPNHMTTDFNLDNWVVREAEVYSDIPVRNAQLYLHGTLPYWERLFRDHITNFYQAEAEREEENYRPSHRSEYDDVSVSGELRNFVRVSVYAKTDNRIRMEVRYLRRTLRTTLGITREQLAQRFDSFEEFMRLTLNAGIQDVRTVIGRLPDFIRDGRTSQEPISISEYAEFLSALQSALLQTYQRDTQHSDGVDSLLYNQAYERILSACMTRGYVTVHNAPPTGSLHDIMKQALQAMLRYFNRSTIYRGTPQHRRYTLKPVYFGTFMTVASAFPDHRARFALGDEE